MKTMFTITKLRKNTIKKKKPVFVITNLCEKNIKIEQKPCSRLQNSEKILYKTKKLFFQSQTSKRKIQKKQ